MFTLTFDGQLSIYKLGTVGATSGRFVLDMGDGLSSVPQFWGVATLETNFTTLEQYGLKLFAKGTLQINLTGVTHTETLTLRGLGDGGTDLTRTFVLNPYSFGLELVGQAIVMIPGTTTELMRVQGGFFLNIQATPTPSLQMYLTGELSFGSGNARLVYGSVTGLLLMSTDTSDGGIPGVAGSFTVSSGGGIGLPNMGTLFSATGSVSIMFNTTMRDRHFKIPDAFLPLLHPGEPTEIVIFGSAPGLDGQRRADAPAGGEAYIKATIQAQLTIGGVISLNGFIGLTAAVGPEGAYIRVDGAVGTTIPFLGSLTGVINLAVYAGASRTGVVGRIQLTLGSNSIPGVRFNGQFLVEINTFASEQQIQTFAVSQSGGRFNGFVRDAAGNLVVTTQTIKTTGGFRLEMGGELVIADTLRVNGHVLLTLSLAGANPMLELVVNGTIDLAPIGTLSLVDSGFRINADGLVARVQISLGAGGFGGGVGLGFTANSTLSLNTTGRAQTLGSSTVEAGFLLHIDGSIDFLGIASGTGVLDVRVAPNGFELTFALKFVLGPLTFDASGGAAVYGGSDPGFAMRLQIHAAADALVFSIDASGTMQLNTRNATTIGIAGKSFLLDVNGTVSILKVFTFDAGMHFEIGREIEGGPQKKGAWFFRANAGVDFFGLASLSGTIFLNSDGDFDLQLAGYMQLGTSSFGLRGDFSIGITSIHETTPVEYYYFRLAGSASVRVRAFGVTLVGLGIGFEFEFDTRNIGMDGRVPIVLSVHIEVDLWLFSVNADASFTIGYLQFPKPTYMGSNGVLTNGTYRTWNASDRVLVLNVGDQAHRTARNIGTDPTDTSENVLVEQVGAGPDGATIKVSAYGRSNTYEHVTSISADFGDGNDIVTIAPTVTVPVTFSAGSGSDAITFAGTGGATLSGGDGIDSISVTGSGDATVNGGGDGDFLEHEGTGTVTLNGGDGNDVLTGSSLTDVLNGDGDGDALQGLAGTYDGGTGNDNITITLDTNRVPVIRGGDGTDVLTLTLSGGADVLVLGALVQDGQDGVRLGLNGVDRDTTGLERLLVDAGTGSDTLEVGYLAAALLTEVSIDVGTGGADTVVVHGSSAARHRAVTYVNRAGRPAGEVSVAGIGGYDVFVGRTVRAQGDVVEIRGRGWRRPSTRRPSPAPTASPWCWRRGRERHPRRHVVRRRARRRRRQRPGHRAARPRHLRRLRAAPTPSSRPSNGDFGLYDNLFVVGLVAGNNVDFASGVVEDLGGIFEAAELTGGAGANHLPRRRHRRHRDRSPASTRTADPWTGDATLNPRRLATTWCASSSPGPPAPGPRRRLHRLGRPARGLGHQPARRPDRRRPRAAAAQVRRVLERRRPTEHVGRPPRRRARRDQHPRRRRPRRRPPHRRRAPHLPRRGRRPRRGRHQRGRSPGTTDTHLAEHRRHARRRSTRRSSSTAARPGSSPATTC